MTDVDEAISWLRALTECRCDGAHKSSGASNVTCNNQFADDVDVVVNEIERLRAERDILKQAIKGMLHETLKWKDPTWNLKDLIKIGKNALGHTEAGDSDE